MLIEDNNLKRLSERKRALERAVFAFTAKPYKPDLTFLKILDNCVCHKNAMKHSKPLTTIDIYDN